MKLQDLKSIELKAIEIPERISTPDWVDNNILYNRIFGAFCRINPELSCMEDKRFIKNVFTCIRESGGKDLLTNNSDLVNFVKKDKEIQKWRNWYQTQKDIKVEYRKIHKDEIKKENEERKEKYGFAIVNGIREPLQSWILEPEGIFFGRGDCPYSGMWKKETSIEDVIVNTNSKNLPIVIKDKKEINLKNYKVSWDPTNHTCATYKILIGVPNKDENIIKPKHTVYKNIMFGSTSSIKKEGQSKKYNAASVLGKSYEKILKQIEKDFNNNKNLDTVIAVYMLFQKGIRIGQRNPTNNGTKGLLSLEWNKDVKRIDNKIKFDFYGKDSVHDISFIESDFSDQIEKCWSNSIKLNTTKEEIENYISNIVPELKNIFTPKLCRTAVAAYTMQKALESVNKKYSLTKDSNDTLKKIAFEEANMEVAKRLNHQKGVNKVAEQKRKEKFKENQLKLKEREIKTKELIKKRQDKIKELQSKNGSKDQIKKLKEMIEKSKMNLNNSKLKESFKEQNQNFTSSTSKGAYIDPTIVKEWSELVNLPLEKIYSKTQLEQFKDYFN